jgi:DNA (cytosine-5)-methyltransferase 1
MSSVSLPFPDLPQTVSYADLWNLGIEGATLSDLFSAASLRVENLRYEDARRKVWRGGAAVLLDDLSAPANGIELVSFFTGCGGMDLGFEAAGFHHVAAFEINELFCKTLRRNRPNWRIFGPPTHSGDVSRFDEVSQALNPLIPSPFDGVFVGGPPCQPFSIAANQRFSRNGANFKRVGFQHEKNGNLFFDYIRLILAFRPKAFVIENVPGLRDLDGGEQLAAAIADLEDAGYRVHPPRVLDAADFLVPQQRLRLFVVGSRDSARTFEFPRKAPMQYGAGAVLSLDPVLAPNHEVRDHLVSSVLRYMKLGYGERDQLGRVDRLDPTVPSKTVIAGGLNGGGRSHLHPEIPRTLSVRECARLQTFPDSYVFVGPTARQFTQVGNAVPPVLAAQIAKSVHSSLF